MRKTRRNSNRVLVALAAMAILPLGSVSSAVASTGTDFSTQAITQVQGSHSCGPSQSVRIVVYLNSPGDVYFDRYLNGRWTTVGSSRGGSAHVHNYAARSVQWKVLSHDIASVTEGCI